MLCAQTWWAPYYRFGIPVYFHGIAAPSGSLPDRAALEAAFTTQPQLPRLRFRQLTQQIFAFREAYFEGGSGVRYLPALHSVLRMDPRRGRLNVTGYLNWYVLFILIYIILKSLGDPSFIFVAVLVLIIFGLSYIVQWHINRSVTSRIEELITGPA